MEWLYSDQVRSLASNWFCVAAYIAVIFLTKTDKLYKPMIAMVLCQLFSMSPLYSLLVHNSGNTCLCIGFADSYCETKQASIDFSSAVFLVYSAIYFTVIRYLSTYKVMLACFIMAAFELIVYKAYRDEIGIVWVESFLYENYELLVTLCHLAIINSVLNWRKIINSVRDYCLPLFRFVGRYSCALPYGC